MMNMKNIINNNNVVPSYRGIPSQRTPSKVRTIPIHFVGSERSRENSAIKIQKVLRGFFVRNALKRIMGLRVELQSVEAKVYASMEVIKRDQRERVRVSETIMNLLLKLDSVRVLSSWYGVRECRKSVIKKAIALQEMVESESACVVEENGVEENDAMVQEEEKVVEVSEEKEEEKMEVMDDDSGADIKCVSESCMNSCVEEKEEEKMEDSGVDIQCVSESYKIEEEEEGDGEREESVGTSLVEENENNCVQILQNTIEPYYKLAYIVFRIGLGDD
ncbi:BAG family molecular chaperone regulator 5, mitochondrial-like [Arachis stenosperma]|uniref:BAG family molecular chaperone regulator 5, mitochondrial-like n=1 Tax=Arachis stenosperma TaxID=217475 RepID=UPI0025AC0B4E|nr:BAG family molecular chaperone regulator 5, mitochondrial-like [Arachis stenosperma]